MYIKHDNSEFNFILFFKDININRNVIFEDLRIINNIIRCNFI